MRKKGATFLSAVISYSSTNTRKQPKFFCTVCYKMCLFAKGIASAFHRQRKAEQEKKKRVVFFLNLRITQCFFDKLVISNVHVMLSFKSGFFLNRCMKLCFYILKCLANNFEYNNFELFKDSMKNAGQFSADYIVSFLRYGGLG